MLKLKHIINRCADFIIYGNFFIALCATASTLSTVVLFSSFVDVHDVEQALFVGAATFVLYNLHKPITYFLKKQFVDNQRFRRAAAFKGPLSILTVLAGFYCCYFFFYLKLNSQLLLASMGFLSLGYVLPILGKGRRLRDLPFVKIFLIALVWASITVGLPYLDLKNTPFNTPFWCLSVERACFIFALCISFDIRDVDCDARANVKTIPLSIGVKNAKIMGVLAIIMAITMVLCLKNAHFYGDELSFKLIVVYLIASFILIKTDKSRNDYFFYGVVDGLILLQSLVIIFG